ncbi:hypothetical protein J6590_069907 [Homalodisca vitripennis]|nr:hypothetical protein J6590_069907 [Homalodisca vitripennis]
MTSSFLRSLFCNWACILGIIKKSLGTVVVTPLSVSPEKFQPIITAGREKRQDVSRRRGVAGGEAARGTERARRGEKRLWRETVSNRVRGNQKRRRQTRWYFVCSIAERKEDRYRGIDQPREHGELAPSQPKGKGRVKARPLLRSAADNSHT